MIVLLMHGLFSNRQERLPEESVQRHLPLHVSTQPATHRHLDVRPVSQTTGVSVLTAARKTTGSVCLVILGVGGRMVVCQPRGTHAHLCHQCPVAGTRGPDREVRLGPRLWRHVNKRAPADPPGHTCQRDRCTLKLPDLNTRPGSGTQETFSFGRKAATCCQPELRVAWAPLLQGGP